VIFQHLITLTQQLRTCHWARNFDLIYDKFNACRICTFSNTFFLHQWHKVFKFCHNVARHFCSHRYYVRWRWLSNDAAMKHSRGTYASVGTEVHTFADKILYLSNSKFMYQYVIPELFLVHSTLILSNYDLTVGPSFKAVVFKQRSMKEGWHL
jgi:hypothetical protein